LTIIQHVGRPKGTFSFLHDFSVEFLSAKAGAFILVLDSLQVSVCEVGSVIEGRTCSDMNFRVLEECPDKLGRLGGSGYTYARVLT